VTLSNDNGTDGQTDGRTDRVRRNMRPPPTEEGRIIITLVVASDAMRGSLTACRRKKDYLLYH